MEKIKYTVRGLLCLTVLVLTLLLGFFGFTLLFLLGVGYVLTTWVIKKFRNYMNTSDTRYE